MDLTLLHPDKRHELSLRVEKVKFQMQIAGMDGLLVGSPTNLYYLGGGVFRGYVYIPVDRDPIFFMIPPSEGIGDMCHTVRKPEMIAGILESQGIGKAGKLGLEFDDLSYSEVRRLMRALPAVEYSDATPVLRMARLIKTDYELRLMRQDGMRQAEVYKQIKHCYQEDMTDMEFQIEIERVLRREGCLGYLRAAGNRMQLNMGSVIAGANADVPSPYDFSMGGAGTDPSLPVGASGEIMKPGTAVMVDMNGGFNGYQTDMTRCWTIGEVPEKAVRAHECSIAILRDLERFAHTDVAVGDVYRRARRLADDAGLADCFMGHNHKVAFIGHGVGIELNEMPVVMERNDTPLLGNMTIALEPKFVIPGVGALGVENTYIVTDTGLENITVLDESLKQL